MDSFQRVDLHISHIRPSLITRFHQPYFLYSISLSHSLQTYHFLKDKYTNYSAPAFHHLGKKRERIVVFIRFTVTGEQTKFPSFAWRNMMQLGELIWTVLIGEKWKIERQKHHYRLCFHIRALLILLPLLLPRCTWEKENSLVLACSSSAEVHLN